MAQKLIFFHCKCKISERNFNNNLNFLFVERLTLDYLSLKELLSWWPRLYHQSLNNYLKVKFTVGKPIEKDDSTTSSHTCPYHPIRGLIQGVMTTFSADWCLTYDSLSDIKNDSILMKKWESIRQLLFDPIPPFSPTFKFTPQQKTKIVRNLMNVSGYYRCKTASATF